MHFVLLNVHFSPPQNSQPEMMLTSGTFNKIVLQSGSFCDIGKSKKGHLTAA